MSTPFISVCIPTYEMRGHGADFLRQSFSILAKQTFKDFEVVVSDHASDATIRAVCDEFKDRLSIRYMVNHNRVGSSSANLNNAIKHATGKLIKILFQDDYLVDEQALATIVDSFVLSQDHWLVTGSEHTHDGQHLERPYLPRFTPNPQYGENLIGSPSVLTVRNDHPLLFDERLMWLMDGDYYKRLAQKYGPPKIVKTITVVNRLGNHQVTATAATQESRESELAYVKRKYSRELKKKIQLPRVTLVAVSSIKIQETITALQVSADRIAFYDVVLISDIKPKNLPPEISLIPGPPLPSLNEYSKFIAYDLAKFIDSDFALVIQYDGFVVRPEQWRDDFLAYDYIGAPWQPEAHFTKEHQNVRVGNGGFSLRSKKLLNALNDLHLPFIDANTGYYNEDGLISCYYRHELENHGVRFSPVDVAARFSHEEDCPETNFHSFGYHKNVRTIPLSFFLRHPFKGRGVLRIRAIIILMKIIPPIKKFFRGTLGRQPS